MASRLKTRPETPKSSAKEHAHSSVVYSSVHRRRFLLAFAPVVLLAFVFQQSVMTHLTIFGVHPDVELMIALFVAIASGAQRGAIVGFVLGLLHDVFATNSLGLCALSYAIAAYLVGSISEGTDELLWVSSLLGAFGSVVASLIVVALGAALGDIHVSLLRSAWIVTVISALNAIVIPIAIGCLRIRNSFRREPAW